MEKLKTIIIKDVVVVVKTNHNTAWEIVSENRNNHHPQKDLINKYLLGESITELFVDSNGDYVEEGEYLADYALEFADGHEGDADWLSIGIDNFRKNF